MKADILTHTVLHHVLQGISIICMLQGVVHASVARNPTLMQGLTHADVKGGVIFAGVQAGTSVTTTPVRICCCKF